MVDRLLAFFQKPKQETENDSPEGFCPNCWGEQEYGGTIRELYEDHQIDVNNHQAHHSFIQKFVVNRIDGIHLKKEEDNHVCPTCNKIHKN